MKWIQRNIRKMNGILRYLVVNYCQLSLRKFDLLILSSVTDRLISCIEFRYAQLIKHPFSVREDKNARVLYRRQGCVAAGRPS